MASKEKVAKILRVDKNVIEDLDKKAWTITGKLNVFDKIIEQNNALIKDKFGFKEFSKEINAEEIYNALMGKIKEDDIKLCKAFKEPSLMSKEDIDGILEKIKELLPQEDGFFLKKEKAIELLKKEPPKKIISYLGYKDVDELISREDVFEIFAAIRLFEDSQWFNDVFVNNYLDLKPEDFEKRPIEMKALNKKWVGITQLFLKKKYQNISHLKEIGFIFVVPIELGIIGEMTRMFSLALHYFFEVKFNSELFELFSQQPESFAKNLISTVRVDIIDKKLPETDKLRWLILPRYLAKYDENDWRVREPHISPEALYWLKAERILVDIGKILKEREFYADFSFWLGLDYVGDYFKTSAGIEVLVSFDLVDAIMSLIREKELEKYLYHQQEALWNKIFIEYFGEEKLEAVLKENFVKGYVEM